MNVAEKQAACYEVLIKRFGGPPVNLSRDLYDKVANGTASESELNEYTEKADALANEVKKFYRDNDFANQEISDEDADVLIAMTSTGYSVHQEQTTHITRLLPNENVEKTMQAAKTNQSIDWKGYSASSEQMAGTSASQDITARGTDYEGSPYMTDGKPNPTATYMKAPYTQEVKDSEKIVMDPRVFERLKERAEKAGEPISSMGNDLRAEKVRFTYKSKNKSEDDSELTEEQKQQELDEYRVKHKEKYHKKFKPDPNKSEEENQKC